MTEMTTEEPGTAIATFDTDHLPAALQNRATMQAMVARVKALADAHVALNLDMSDEDNRQATRSLAYKIAQSKSSIDGPKKELTEEWRKKTAAVNAVAKEAIDALQAEQDRVRAPLTLWETAEAQRKAAIEARINNVLRIGQGEWAFEKAAEIRERITLIESIVVDDSGFHEMCELAEAVKGDSLRDLQTYLEAAEKREAEQAELEAFRREKAEREAAAKKDADEKAAAERAAARQKAEEERQAAEALAREEAAQRAAQAAREAAEREAAEKLAAAEAEKERAAQIAREMAAAADKVQREAAEAAARAEQDAKDREERARLAEQERAAKERREADAAAEKRAKNRSLLAAARKEFTADLEPHLGSDNPEVRAHLAGVVFDLLAGGKLRHARYEP